MLLWPAPSPSARGLLPSMNASGRTLAATHATSRSVTLTCSMPGKPVTDFARFCQIMTDDILPLLEEDRYRRTSAGTFDPTRSPGFPSLPTRCCTSHRRPAKRPSPPPRGHPDKPGPVGRFGARLTHDERYRTQGQVAPFSQGDRPPRVRAAPRHLYRPRSTSSHRPAHHRLHLSSHPDRSSPTV